MSWYGQPEAVTRLILGHGTALPTILAEVGVPAVNIPAVMQVIIARLGVQILPPAMPIQDTIDLAEFLVHTASMFSRFLPGAQVVGGPVESVAITKHEGFKWVKRKHYYDPRLNPEGKSE